MTRKLGVYWAVMHRRPQDYAYFKLLQPSVIKVMDGGTNDYQWIRTYLPDSLVVACDHALSEQHDDMLRDPKGTGKRHAQEWDKHQARLGFDRDKTLVLGINEPKIWDAGVAEALRQYSIALCEEAAKFHLRVGAMQLSVGWPNNKGDESPPDWSPFDGVEQAIKRGRHMLVVHEYWADAGPKENWGWWGGRVLKCPWQVPIVIGECGVDLYVKNSSIPHSNRGWRGHMSAERYADELAEYTSLMSADSRFMGCCVFASDYANAEWYSFDVEPAYDWVIMTPETTPPPTTTPPPDSGVYLNGRVTAPLGLNVRNEPNVNATKIGALAFRSTVLYDNTENGWLHLAEGWVSGDWVNGDEPELMLLPANELLIHPLPGSIVTQHWGENGKNYSKWGMWGHNGVDFGGKPQGTPIGAIAQGVIVDIAWDPEGYGAYLKLYHERLSCYSFYAHCHEILGAVGDVIEAGETIATLGNTGNSTGTHLHLEIRLCNADKSYKQGTPMKQGRVCPESWAILHGLPLATGVKERQTA